MVSKAITPYPHEEARRVVWEPIFMKSSRLNRSYLLFIQVVELQQSRLFLQLSRTLQGSEKKSPKSRVDVQQDCCFSL